MLFVDLSSIILRNNAKYTEEKCLENKNEQFQFINDRLFKAIPS